MLIERLHQRAQSARDRQARLRIYADERTAIFELSNKMDALAFRLRFG